MDSDFVTLLNVTDLGCLVVPAETVCLSRMARTALDVN